MKTPYVLLGTIASMLISTAALAATSSSSSYNRTNVSDSPFTGPYVGGFGGYDWTDADTNVAGFNPDIRGWEGGVFAGFRVDGLLNRMNGLGIGLNGAIEGFYGWSNSDDHIGGVRVEKDNEWGVSFRPGLSFIDEAMSPVGFTPYGIIGYRNTKFDAFAGGASGSERYNGLEAGVGTQLLASGHWGLRAEYSHVWYRAENGVDPDSDNVRMGLSYQF